MTLRSISFRTFVYASGTLEKRRMGGAAARHTHVKPSQFVHRRHGSGNRSEQWQSGTADGRQFELAIEGRLDLDTEVVRETYGEMIEIVKRSVHVPGHVRDRALGSSVCRRWGTISAACR